MKRLGLLLVLVCLLAPAARASTEGRRVAILLDTSSSMRASDPQRYTAQISKILADLAENDDEVTAIRIPRKSFFRQLLTGGGAESCSSPASSALSIRLDSVDRDRFERQIDDLVTYDTGNYFAAPIRTAIEALTLDRSRERMLLMVADSGGLGPCERPLTRELSRLHDSGAVVAAVNLGGPGAFDGNPAFDFTLGARDSQGLIEAVAHVYQRFLGSKGVQTGRVDGLIEVEIEPHVAEAYLVVAADGPMSAIEQVRGNPGARRVDPNHRSGGTTRGLDGRPRSYRIVRMEVPDPGRWRFRAPGLGATAGWLLLQDSSLAVRLASRGPIPRAVTSPVELEVYDTVTGERLKAPCELPGLHLELEAAGENLRPRDDGGGADRRAGDCLYTAPVTLDEAGKQELTVRLTTDTLDRTLRLAQDVVDLAWRLKPEPPEQARAGEAATLRTRLEPIAPGTSAEPPEAVEARSEGSLLAHLEDHGTEPDETAEDGVYSGTWTPAEPGEVDIHYEAVGGAATQPGQGAVRVVGVLELGDVPPARFGTLATGDRSTALLDLSGARVEGAFELRLSTDFRNARSLLEIETDDGWTALGDAPVRVTLARGERTSWPLRLRVGSCPGGVPDGTHHEIAIEAVGPGGTPLHAAAPLTVVIEPEPWLRCWWPLLALAGGVLLVSVVIHGYWSPSRFPRRLGVVLSPEEDMTEGFFHGIRAQKGSGVGLYRDATIHVCEDFRLSGRKAGALAALRADGSRVRIAPAPGATVWRRAADGEWEQLPADETPARFGIVYRNDAGSLFFELRNA